MIENNDFSKKMHNFLCDLGWKEHLFFSFVCIFFFLIFILFCKNFKYSVTIYFGLPVVLGSFFMDLEKVSLLFFLELLLQIITFIILKINFIEIFITPSILFAMATLAVISYIVSISRKVKNVLKDSEEKYRLLVENTDDVIWILDIAKQKFTYISPSIYKLRGYTVEEAISQTMEESLSHDSYEKVRHELPIRIQKYKNRDKSLKFLITEITQSRKNGKDVLVEISTTLLEDKKGEVTEILGISRNVEQREKMDLQLLEKNKEIKKNYNKLIEYSNELKEANAMKDKFFSIIAHDLRSPVSTFENGISLLLKEKSQLSPEDKITILNELKTDANKIFRLLENLLKWTRIQKGDIYLNPAQISLFLLVFNCIEIYSSIAKEKNINIINEASHEIKAYADEYTINTVLRNLISNAIKFTNDNGKVVIKCEERNNEIEVSVIDNGIGMKDEKKEKLFKISENISSKGTKGEKGNGLGKGSKFVFTLPKEKV